MPTKKDATYWRDYRERKRQAKESGAAIILTAPTAAERASLEARFPSGVTDSVKMIADLQSQLREANVEIEALRADAKHLKVERAAPAADPLSFVLPTKHVVPRPVMRDAATAFNSRGSLAVPKTKPK